MSNFRNMKSSNPFLKEDVLRNNPTLANEEKMTVQGAVNKTFILFALMLMTGVYAFTAPSSLLMIVGFVGGLIAVLVASFKPKTSHISAPIYALFEGLAVGSITAMYSQAYDGIVMQAVTLTIGILFMMLFLYKAKIIVVTDKLRSGIMMATGAIFIVYMASWILGMFGIAIPYLHSNGLMGIGISLAIVGVASFNFLLDFDFIERSAKMNAPRYMEWYGALGLMVTLIWLYLEILRLLAKLSSRD